MSLSEFGKIFLVVFFALSIPIDGTTQVRQDIGYRIEAVRGLNHLLEYRLPVKPKLNLVLAVGYLSGVGRDHYTARYLFQTVGDSLVGVQSRLTEEQGLEVRIGLQRRLRWPIFSFRTDLTVGYTRLTDKRWADYYLLDSLDGWNPFFHQMSYTENSMMRTDKIALGGNFSFNLDVPLSKRFVLGLFVSHWFRIKYDIAKVVEEDQLNEFDYFYQYGRMHFDLATSVGAALRFRFGAERAFVQPGDH